MCCVFGRGFSDGGSRSTRCREEGAHATLYCTPVAVVMTPGFLLFSSRYFSSGATLVSQRSGWSARAHVKTNEARRTARPADDDPLCAGNIARIRMIVTTSARRTASLSPDRACRAIVHFADQGRTPRFDKVFSSFSRSLKFQEKKTVQAPSGTSGVRLGPGTCSFLGRGARPR